jgi:hypothetical protein
MTDTNKKATVPGLRPMETAPESNSAEDRLFIYFPSEDDTFYRKKPFVAYISEACQYGISLYGRYPYGAWLCKLEDAKGGWLPLPTGETYNRQTKLEFGNGAIFVGCGVLKYGTPNAFVCFKDTGISHNVGESRGETTGKDVEESDVLLEFYCADSVDVVIRHLEEAKELMQDARGVETKEKPAGETYTREEVWELLNRAWGHGSADAQGYRSKDTKEILDEFAENPSKRIYVGEDGE